MMAQIRRQRGQIIDRLTMEAPESIEHEPEIKDRHNEMKFRNTRQEPVSNGRTLRTFFVFIL
jgi:hypothetical protein